MDGFLQRPTAPANNPGVTLAKANTFPIGYYTNRHHDRTRKAVPDLPVIGALAENYTVLDRYFCSFAGETFPNRFYQHAGTDRSRPQQQHDLRSCRRSGTSCRRSPTPQGIPTGGYFFRDLPFLALWGTKYFPFWHPVRARRRRRAGDSGARRRRSSRPSRREIFPTSASSTPPSTPRGTAPRPTTTRWPTSGSASGSSPTRTTRSPTPDTSTRRSSS